MFSIEKCKFLKFQYNLLAAWRYLRWGGADDGGGFDYICVHLVETAVVV